MKTFATKRKIRLIIFYVVILSLVFGVGGPGGTAFATQDPDPTPPAGCATSTTHDNSSGFVLDDFQLSGIDLDNSHLKLPVGSGSIDPDNIVIPYDQEVWVTFLYEGAGYVSDFGWMYAEDGYATDTDGDGVNDSGFKGWNNISQDKKRPLFIKIVDDNETGGCCGGGNGILDSDYGNGGTFPTSNSLEYKLADLEQYNDGSGVPFVINNDGEITPLDMKKKVGQGKISGGKEIVFFLVADKRWTTTSANSVFYSKAAWNHDGYSRCEPGSDSDLWINEGKTKFKKQYDTGTALSGEGGCQVENEWLATPVFARMNDYFNVSLNGIYDLIVDTEADSGFQHVIVGAPEDDPNQWILGWDDQPADGGSSDVDHNDMVFRVERKTGGQATLKLKDALTLSGDQYYTAVTIEVKDELPCPGKTRIIYEVAINGDAEDPQDIDWIPVEVEEWMDVRALDESNNATGDNLKQIWTPGTPKKTYRLGRIDFAGLGLSGSGLVWRAKVESDVSDFGGEICEPLIIDVKVTGNVATHASFSRSSPVVEGNVIMSGSYETPAADWTDKTLRGHLKATRIYDPADPSETSQSEIWNAGEGLNQYGDNPLVTVDQRIIYMPDVSDTTEVTDEVIGTGDGVKTFFYKQLDFRPISAGTLTITDGHETFQDEGTNSLVGNWGGQGSINRFTGVAVLTFKKAPTNGVQITADYTYYSITAGLKEFTTANVNSTMLGLTNDYTDAVGFKYDFNEDNKFNNVDKDGNGTANDSDADWLVEWVRGYADGSTKNEPKEWLLGAIDHSVPAVVIPPGIPSWYHGKSISTSMRNSYDVFRENKKERRSVVYVGARDGMIHAFDGGMFLWGDNDQTDFAEKKGYYKWSGNTSDTADYGNGKELWAFIPANLIPRLKNNALRDIDQAYVDASPAIADVYINNQWRTVLLAAQGNGGDTVFCLDVTNPTNPSFLWEYADPDLYRSISSPAIASIGRMLGEDGQAKWAAFFVSGRAKDALSDPKIYIINVADGTVIRKMLLDSAGQDGKGGTPSGQPAIIDSDGNGFIDRVYIGTDKGFLYKVIIPDSQPGTPTDCYINQSFEDPNGNIASGNTRLPIYASPAVVVGNTLNDDGTIGYDVKIFYGTGDSPYYAETINQPQNYAFFAYSDTDAKDECTDASLEWYKELAAGHRIWASAFAAAGQIYFGTSTSETEDPCEGYMSDGSTNAGRIYSLNMETGVSVGLPADGELVGNVIASPLVEDQHLYIKSTSTGGEPISFGSGVYNNAAIMKGIISTEIKSWRQVY